MFQKMFLEVCRLIHKQWGAGAQGPEHDGAYLEQVTCSRLREGSDVLGAREDPGRRGREASKHAAEVGNHKRDAHRRSHSVHQKVSAGALG